MSVPGWDGSRQDWLALRDGLRRSGFSAASHAASLAAPGSDAALSYTTPRRSGHVEELVDFDRLNQGGVRLSVGAVEVVSGDKRESTRRTSGSRSDHILASGALPPGFPR